MLVPRAATFDEAQRVFLMAILRDCKGNRSLAARRLGMHRRTLQRMLDKWG